MRQALTSSATSEEEKAWQQVMTKHVVVRQRTQSKAFESNDVFYFYMIQQIFILVGSAAVLARPCGQRVPATSSDPVFLLVSSTSWPASQAADAEAEWRKQGLRWGQFHLVAVLVGHCLLLGIATSKPSGRQRGRRGGRVQLLTHVASRQRSCHRPF